LKYGQITIHRANPFTKLFNSNSFFFIFYPYHSLLGDPMPLRFLTAGESHGPSLTTILDGLPAGLPLTIEIINKELARRQQGYGSGGRMKIEKDTVQILGGVMGGETTGAPIALLVQNDDHVKWKGKAVEPMTAPRPGHADLTGAVKYG
jgi:chorismate synthase